MVSPLPDHLHPSSLCSFLLFSLGSQFLHRRVEEFISVSIKGRWPDPFLLSLTGLEPPSVFSATTHTVITARAGHSGDLMRPGDDFPIGSNRQPCSFMGLAFRRDRSPSTVPWLSAWSCCPSRARPDRHLGAQRGNQILHWPAVLHLVIPLSLVKTGK